MKIQSIDDQPHFSFQAGPSTQNPTPPLSTEPPTEPHQSFSSAPHFSDANYNTLTAKVMKLKS